MSKFLIFIALATIVAIYPDVTVEAFKLCGTKLTMLLSDTCKFRNEKWPCYKGEAFYQGGYAGRGLERETSTRLGVATDCCENECSIDVIAKRCCFTSECLQSCYPNSSYDKMDSQVFQFFLPTTTLSTIEYDDAYLDGEDDGSFSL
ncbi:hypothetical protein L596_015133 [Steinernema carpocapsae]|uniref:Insulin-like domain-containing protein n=1 Tax=Steinernema carpocapsae TaxID=34508 RepID=A0A4V6A311_STECR|nr:hypothetical protein L596_015133 [Steinernema carpocapsae]